MILIKSSDIKYRRKIIGTDYCLNSMKSREKYLSSSYFINLTRKNKLIHQIVIPHNMSDLY